MESSVLNAQDCGVTPGAGYGETNRTALQHAVDEMQVAGGGTSLSRRASTNSLEQSTSRSERRRTPLARFASRARAGPRLCSPMRTICLS